MAATNGKGGWAVEFSGRVLSGVTVALLVAIMLGVGNLFLRVGTIESNRFTAMDWIRERRDLRQEMLSEIPGTSESVILRLERLERDVAELQRIHRNGRGSP